MSDLPDFPDEPISNVEQEDFLLQAIELTDALFGDSENSNQIRVVLESCDTGMRYFKIGRTIVRADGTTYSTIDVTVFEPGSQEPTDESDEESLIISSVSGKITSFDIDTYSEQIKVSRGFGRLTLNAIGEVELELEDTLDADEIEDDTELCDVLQPNTLYVSDVFLLLDATKNLVKK